MTAPQGPSAPPASQRGLLTTALALVAEVEPQETLSVVLLTLDSFLLLASYYFLKVIREPLILAVAGGAELKSYATAALAVLLIGVFYAYRAVAKRVGRMRLITLTKLFCVACLVVFSLLGRLGVPLGVPFYLWVGCYSLTIIAQFWSFANDVYTPAQGKRLFAVVGLGSSIGAVVGAKIAGLLVKPLGFYNMMLVPAGVLLICLAILGAVNRWSIAQNKQAAAQAEAPPGGAGGASMIFRDRYLLLMAALILVLNLVNTNGEYILDKTMNASIAGMDDAARGVFIGEFKSSYFTWANAVGVFLQLFFVSRIFKYLDVRGALFIYPVLALLSYGTMSFLPLFAIVRVAKIGENSVDYSIYNTAKQALYLPTSREVKYVAKQAIDTFVVRSGDLISGGLVVLGVYLKLAPQHFAMMNVALALVWIGVVVLIGREHQRKTAEARLLADEAGKGEAGKGG
jgi:AAA family ATP:ADP antiporter